ncbi:hypothetical protein DID77_02275 [Candidatus Marinamargulisbacteria bacterium SCGC AG-439-L15]|nr:hypothetical protein DID77_02275 [Candidatus Marinamargulisbacteria bacterium SCGC AG-439-L15]
MKITAVLLGLFCLFLGGCEDLKRLKTIKNLGMLYCTFDYRVYPYDSSKRVSNPTPMFTQETKTQLPPADIRVFHDRFTKKLTQMIQTDFGLQVVTPESFWRYPSYQNLMFKYVKGEYTPYKPLLLQSQSRENIRQLCKDIKVDAVFGIKVYFLIEKTGKPYWEKEKDPFSKTTVSRYWRDFLDKENPTRLWMKGDVSLLYKDGKEGINRSFMATADGRDIRVAYTDVFDFDMRKSVLHERVSEALLEKIKGFVLTQMVE